MYPRIDTHLPWPKEIASYGLMLAVGLLFALIVTVMRAKREKVKPDLIWDLWLVLTIAGVIGARLFYVIQNFSEFRAADGSINFLGFFAFWNGGLVFHGGLILAVIAGAIFLKIKKFSFLRMADIVMPGIALGLSFGRIGCFLNGCCWGKPTGSTWGAIFSRSFWTAGDKYVLHPIWIQQVQQGIVSNTSTHTVPVHPTQLYSSFLNLLIFVVLAFYFPHRKTNGEVLWLFLILYGIHRFFIEFVRAESPVILWGLKTAQFVSLLMILAGIVGFIFARVFKKGKRLKVQAS